ncbi:phosphoribosyl-ATP pyrophosphohydrolase [Thiovulum sp. ES]|nr:phosphoribosyl-ATP pyrophosphohydrolase [Thiovulum sp. ES]
MLENIDWKKVDNLLPVVVQDWKDNSVLMLAYMNREALELTLKTGFAHYFSRTKGRLWKKGEESGHTQKVMETLLDCDGDTILLKVEQKGVACHTGRETCFFTNLQNGDEVAEIKEDLSEKYSVIDQLFHTIEERKREGNSDKSYTAKLLNGGANRILKKVIEEAGEFSLAVKDRDEKEIILESADLLYHTLVALSYSNVNPDKVREEIKKRFGIGGLVEKASRGK